MAEAKSFIAWFAGFRPARRRPAARRPKLSASAWLMIAGGFAAVAVVIAAAALLRPSPPPPPPRAAGRSAGQDANSGQVSRAAAFDRELFPLRRRFGDRDGSRLMAAWADARGRIFCGYYERARPDPAGAVDRFVITGDLIVTEADAPPAQFDQLWTVRCSEAEFQVH